MAVFRPQAPFADLRGSIGQTTYGRNAAGLFARARTPPDDSFPSAEQLACRQNLRDVGAAFATLSDTSRLAWRDLAARTRLRNRLGDHYTPTAWHMFTRLNLFARFLGAAIITTPPAHTHSEIEPFTYTAIAPFGIILYPVARKYGSWNCLFQLSHPYSLNRYYCKGPWQPGVDRIHTNAWFATLPQVLWVQALLVAGKAYFIRSRILNADGSLSPAIINRIQTT